MFHWVTGIPFQSDLHGGAYDDLTLWEQIDEGAHYTPAKKWLFSVPIVLYVAQSNFCKVMPYPCLGSLPRRITHITTHGRSPPISQH